MNSGQTRVLVLLGALLALEVAFSPKVKAIVKDPKQALSTPQDIPALVAYGVGVLLLVALAGYAPNLATMIVVAMLVLVLLAHAGEFNGLVNGATNAVKALSSTKGN